MYPTGPCNGCSNGDGCLGCSSCTGVFGAFTYTTAEAEAEHDYEEEGIKLLAQLNLSNGADGAGAGNNHLFEGDP